MSLWPRNKPMAQPTHFGTGKVLEKPVDQNIANAVRTLNETRCSRARRKSSKAAI